MRIFVPRRAVLTFTLVIAAASAYAQSASNEPTSEIEVRGYYSIPTGDASFSATGSSGSTISLSRDFDFHNRLGFELGYTYRTASGKHKFRVEYDDTRWKRETTLSRSFTFRGETFQANLAASGNLQLKTFRAMYAYRWGTEKFRIGPMVDFGIINTSLKISGTTNNGMREAEGSITKFAATVGYDLDYNPNSKISFFNNLGGIVFKGERLFHVEGGVKYFPIRAFGLVGGYKYQFYKTVKDDNFFQVSTNGPFFGAIVRF
jgi:hypothetical protein